MKKIGIVVADLEEYRPFCALAQKTKIAGGKPFGMDEIVFTLNGCEIRCVLSNCGKVNATMAATYLVSAGCDTLLNFGYSGGISRVCRGEIVLADRYLEHDFDLTMIGYKPCEKPGQEYIYSADVKLLECFKKQLPDVTVGTAVCGDRFICNESERLFLKETFDAVSCDMETAAIASVCFAAKIPFLALRRISDDAGADAKNSYRAMYNGGETSLMDTFYRCLCGLTQENFETE